MHLISLHLTSNSPHIPIPILSIANGLNTTFYAAHYCFNTLLLRRSISSSRRNSPNFQMITHHGFSPFASNFRPENPLRFDILTLTNEVNTFATAAFV